MSPRAWACYSRPSAWQPEWVFPARAEGAAGNHLSSSPVDAWKGFRTETSCADVEVAAVFDCHDALGKVETKAGALTDRVGGEEGLEDPRLDLIRNARSGVGYLDEEEVVIT